MYFGRVRVKRKSSRIGITTFWEEGRVQCVYEIYDSKGKNYLRLIDCGNLMNSGFLPKCVNNFIPRNQHIFIPLSDHEPKTCWPTLYILYKHTHSLHLHSLYGPYETPWKLCPALYPPIDKPTRYRMSHYFDDIPHRLSHVNHTESSAYDIASPSDYCPTF